MVRSENESAAILASAPPFGMRASPELYDTERPRVRLVMRGHSPSKAGADALAPAHHLKNQSRFNMMDCRVKPGHDAIDGSVSTTAGTTRNYSGLIPAASIIAFFAA
jgi:hypothetical protein